jgi:class 3 adenylate cyclase
MAETRRLAAIMAVDVVGYSRLMGEDESGAARPVGERSNVQFVPRLLSRMVLRCLGDGRS